MQTPLNKRVIGRHVGQKRKGSRAKSAQSGLEQPARSIDSGTDSAAATGRHSLWPPSAMQMICRGRLLPACLPATVAFPCHSSPAPLHAWSQQRATASLGHLLGGRATKIKTKQRFPIKATTWPPGNVATPPARATIQCDSIRFGARREGIAQFAPRNYATNACGTRSSQLDIAVVVAVAVAVAVGVANFIT